MSPEDKAKEIVEKMAVPTAIFKINNQSKRNAKVCVDEIIKSQPGLPNQYSSTIGYWQEVKNEIEKL